MNDPYPIPFEWSAEFAAPIPMLYGLLPCPMQCEQGWFMLSDGSQIACPGCGEGLDDNEN